MHGLRLYYDRYISKIQLFIKMVLFFKTFTGIQHPSRLHLISTYY